MLVDPVGHDERRFGIPAEHLLRGLHLGLTERRAVRLGRVLGMRGRVGDVATDDDQRRTGGLGPRQRERLPERAQVVHVGNVLDVPAVGLEPRAGVLRVERERGGSVDRYPVVVVDEDELAEAEGAGQGRRLGGDALHQVAVGADAEDAVVDDLVPRPVVALGEDSFGHRHSHRVREALAERAGRRLDAGCQEVLGVAGRSRLPLTETLELAHRQVVAGEMEGGVLENAGVSGREDEAVAVGPRRVLGARAQELVIDRVGDRRQRHRRAGMPGVRLLDGVHCEDANRVDRQLLEVGAHGNTIPASACADPRGLRGPATDRPGRA